MPKLKLTADNIKFIKANRLKMSGTDMAKLFNVNKNVVNRYMRVNGLVVPQELKNKFKTHYNTGKTSSDKKTDSFLQDNYLSIPEIFNSTPKQIG